MHNTTNKLGSLMIGLLSFIFLFNNFVYASNDYLKTVEIPTYDSKNPSHLLITVANNKWTSANLNNDSYKHFYVEPGNYSSNLITLTADGTVDEKRTISLYGSGTTHPAALSNTLQADIRIKFNNADYWDIHRMSFLHVDTQYEWLYNGSSHNTFNKIHIKDYFYGIRIQHQSNYNTIQNSYFNEMTKAGHLSDNIGIALSTAYQGDGTTIIGTKIINNDFKNACDSFQATGSSSTDVDFAGTIIDSNRMWVDNTMYRDDNGVLDPNGLNSIAENALDFKKGSGDINNPIIVTNNIMWGYRHNYTMDGFFGSKNFNDPGMVISIHYETSHIRMHNNILFDSSRGLAIAAGGADYMSIKNNIIQNCNLHTNSVFGVNIYASSNIEFENNTIVNNNGGFGFYYSNSPVQTNMTFKNNLSIDSGKIKSTVTDSVASGNYTYNSTDNIINATGSVSPETSPNMANYDFEYERFTASPKSKTLIGVISTESSPHYGVAGSSITEEGNTTTISIKENEKGKMWVLDPLEKILTK